MSFRNRISRLWEQRTAGSSDLLDIDHFRESCNRASSSEHKHDESGISVEPSSCQRKLHKAASTTFRALSNSIRSKAQMFYVDTNEAAPDISSTSLQRSSKRNGQRPALWPSMRSKGSRACPVVDIPQDFALSTKKRSASIGPIRTPDLDISHPSLWDVENHKIIMSSVPSSSSKNVEKQPFTLEFFENHDLLALSDLSKTTSQYEFSFTEKPEYKVSKSLNDIAGDDSFVKPIDIGLNNPKVVQNRIPTSSNSTTSGTDAAASISATCTTVSEPPPLFNVTPSYKETPSNGAKPSQDKVFEDPEYSKLGSDPSQAPSMGPRAVWDNARAERDTRYQAVWSMTSTDSVFPRSTRLNKFEQNASQQFLHDLDPKYSEKVKWPYPSQRETEQPADKDMVTEQDSIAGLQVQTMSPSLSCTPGQLPDAVDAVDRASDDDLYGIDTASIRIALHYDRGSDFRPLATRTTSIHDANPQIPQSLLACTKDDLGSTAGSGLDRQTHNVNREAETAGRTHPCANRDSFEEMPRITAAEANRLNAGLPHLAKPAFPESFQFHTLAGGRFGTHHQDPFPGVLPCDEVYEWPTTVKHSPQVRIFGEGSDKPAIPSLIHRESKAESGAHSETKSSDIDKACFKTSLQEWMEQSIRASQATKSDMPSKQSMITILPPLPTLPSSMHPKFAASSAGEKPMSGSKETVTRVIQAEDDHGRSARHLSHDSGSQDSD